jgi:hypothetical protein
LTILFDERTTLGMVRLYVKEAAAKLHDVFERSGRRGMLQGPPSGYANSARNKIDDFFDAFR